ncbi:MAG: ABC transporter ATP-binding protein [Acidimicrobiales bacterium]|nr:ABC transporter ATP-binding protein [Acidimicrobiales bacterium]
MSGTRVIEAVGVTKRFAGIVALDGVDLAIDEGERVGLIGPNGAGKTTFFNCLLGVLRADGGTVSLEGRDVTRLPVHQRARLGIGRTFQRIELFPDSTVREHLLIAERVKRRTGRLWKDVVGLGRPNADEIATCDEVLELLGLADLADEPIERLSLGQGRLVEVGRALMTEPKLLLLDEPSSGLDRGETAALAETLGEVQSQRGFAILLVEHDVELVASFTSRCYLLDFGRLIAQGPTATLMASAEMRHAYLGDLEPASADAAEAAEALEAATSPAGDADDGGSAAGDAPAQHVSDPTSTDEEPS